LESKVNYTVVGLFVVLLGAALIFATFWLSNARRSQPYQTYIVIMHEAVSGLSTQAAVKFNGVQVGYIKSIALNPENPQEVRLILEIEQGTPITESTVAVLMAQGITGITYIGLKAKTARAPLLTAKPGQRYPVIPSVPSFLVQLDTVLQDVTTNLKALSKNFSGVFSQDNRLALSNTLNNIDKVTATLAKNSHQIDLSVKSASRLLHNTAVASEDFPEVIKELRSTLATVQDMTTRVAQTSDQVRNFSEQAMPSTVETLNRLRSVTVNLQQITREIARNPSVIVRGRALPPPGPGEQ